MNSTDLLALVRTRWWCNCPTGSLGVLFQRFMIFLSLIYWSPCVVFAMLKHTMGNSA